MPKRELIFAIDLGSFSIKSVVGQVIPNLPLQVIAKEETPSSGIRRGEVVEVEEVTKKIQQNIEELVKKVGKEGEFGVAYGGMHFSFLESKGVVAVSRADGEVTEEDKERAIEAAKALSYLQTKKFLRLLSEDFL
jgi:cell division protein FtsA